MTIAPNTCIADDSEDEDEFDDELAAAVRFINAREKCSMRRREDDDTDAISSSSRSRRMMVGSFFVKDFRGWNNSMNKY